MRYINDKFKNYAFEALQARFANREEFDHYLDSIGNDEGRNQFLKIAAFYLLLVKNGSWESDVQGTKEKIDYLNDTYKFIAIFSFIESLGANSFVDFYQFLVKREHRGEYFPIGNKAKLDDLYQKYKKEHGSIQKCRVFFNSLDVNLKTELQGLIKTKEQITGDSPAKSIDQLASILYQMRSDFIHNADLIAELNEGTTISKRSGKVYVLDLCMDDLIRFFEFGLVNHFDLNK